MLTGQQVIIDTGLYGLVSDLIGAWYIMEHGQSSGHKDGPTDKLRNDNAPTQLLTPPGLLFRNSLLFWRVCGFFSTASRP